MPVSAAAAAAIAGGAGAKLDSGEDGGRGRSEAGEASWLAGNGWLPACLAACWNHSLIIPAQTFAAV